MQAIIDSQLSFNKKMAKDCLDLIFNQHKPAQAAAKYIAPLYIQHNPNAPDGPQGLIAYATSYIQMHPQLSMDFKRIIAEGDLVVVHSHLKLNPQDRGTAVVDVFRVENDRLVEHWDVIQPIPAQVANKNGMF
jgi:predicted SnoaL-like aldol condensation-catalyzing enzyme